MTKLCVLYDAQCTFCLRRRQWLGAQATFLPLHFVPFQSPELVAQFEGIESFRTQDQLLVVGDDGGVYPGPNAFIMLLFALKDYREWAARLTAPALLPLAGQCFDLLSSNRKKMSKWLSRMGDDVLAEVLRNRVSPVCAEPVLTGKSC